MKIKQFLSNNYKELVQNVGEEFMISELPGTLKEELLFHKYGNILLKYHFLNKVENYNFVWGILKDLKKIQFELSDNIYLDNALATGFYLVHKGYIRLLAENGMAFAVYRSGTTFGDIEVILGQKRNGTAKAMDFCQLYRVHKPQFDQLLEGYPHIRRMLVEEAIQGNFLLTRARE